MQGLLELAGVPYVGCGVLGSAVAMDKVEAKEVAGADGIAQADGVACTRRRWRRRRGRRRRSRRAGRSPWSTQLVDDWVPDVREAGQHGLVDRRVQGRRRRRAAAPASAEALRYDEWIVVEEGVTPGRSSAPCWATTTPRASVPGEIVPGAEFYDYDDKYSDGMAELRIPAPLPLDVVEEVRRLACEVVPRAPGRGHGPGRLLLRGGRPGPAAERDQHHPGVHPHLDVPAAVAGSGPSLPRRSSTSSSAWPSSATTRSLADDSNLRHRERRPSVPRCMLEGLAFPDSPGGTTTGSGSPIPTTGGSGR